MTEEIDFSSYIGKLKALQDEIGRLNYFRRMRGEPPEEDSRAMELAGERNALIEKLYLLMKGGRPSQALFESI